jgi:hypothetical protein
MCGRVLLLYMLDIVGYGTLFLGWRAVQAPSSLFRVFLGDDDPSFIVLTETKFSFCCIPVWDRYCRYRAPTESVSVR